MGYKRWFAFFCFILPVLCCGAEGEESRYLKMAFEAHKRGLYGLSNSQIEKHIRQNPDSPDLDYAFLLYSANSIQLQEYNKAIERLNAFKENYADSPFLKDALTYLTLAYLKIEDVASALSVYKGYEEQFGTSEFLEKQIEEILLQLAVSSFNKDDISESRNLFGLFAEEFKESAYLPVAFYYQGIIFYKDNDFKKARDFLSSALKGAGAIKNDEIVADIHLKLADSLLNLKEDNAASDLYGVIIRKFPGTAYSVWASFQLALIEKRNDNLQKAENLLAGIKGFGDGELNFRIMSELANIKMLREEWQDAEKQLKEITAVFPEHPGVNEVYLQMGFANFNMNRFEQAIKYFKKITDSDADKRIKERGFFGLGYSYYSKGDVAAGFKVWDEFVKEFPGSAFISEILFLKGKNLYEEKDYINAGTYLDRFISEFPESSLYRNALIMLIDGLIEQKKLERAKKLCEDFLKKGKDEFIQFLCGKALYLSKDFKKGKEVFASIESKNPRILVESKYYTAKIYEYEGNREKAQETFLEIISFFPDFPEWVKKAEESIKNLSK